MIVVTVNARSSLSIEAPLPVQSVVGRLVEMQLLAAVLMD